MVGKEEIKYTNDHDLSSKYIIDIKDQNGNSSSINPIYLDSNNYNWTISALDPLDTKTDTVIRDNKIAISNGILTWSNDLEDEYQYKIKILAISNDGAITISKNVTLIKTQSSSPLLAIALASSISIIIILVVLIYLSKKLEFIRQIIWKDWY